MKKRRKKAGACCVAAGDTASRSSPVGAEHCYRISDASQGLGKRGKT
jgi:hypothetical protein